MPKGLTKTHANGVLLPSFTVATLPAASGNKGKLVRVTNGDAGTECAALSDGTNWKVVATGATCATE